MESKTGGTICHRCYILYVTDQKFAEADISVQTDDTRGIGIRGSLNVDTCEGGAVVRLYPESFGNQQIQLTEGAVGIQLAIIGDFFAAA